MMVSSFIFFYVIGAFVFFCRTSIFTAKTTAVLSSQMHLPETKLQQLFVVYHAKILFQTVMMTLFPLSFGFYIIISNCFCNILFVSSGLFTVIWLMVTGILIKAVYYFLTHKIALLKPFDYNHFFQNKEFFWIMCPLLYGLLFSFYDGTMFLIIFAIVLGKYIWMDSFRVFSLSEAKIIVTGFFKKHKTDILLLFYQAIVMGYLLIRWYPIKDESIYQIHTAMHTIVTFLLLAFFLMPFLDLLIFKSMQSYSKFIKEQD